MSVLQLRVCLGSTEFCASEEEQWSYWLDQDEDK